MKNRDDREIRAIKIKAQFLEKGLDIGINKAKRRLSAVKID